MGKTVRVAATIALTSGLVCAVAVGPARAQMPRPRLTSLSRTGTAAGESVDVSARGTDLEGVHSLWFDHPGLRAFHLKGTTFRVACAPGTPLGHHDVRAIGPLGVSNPRTFVVGDQPESVEVEPNNTPAQANPLALNSVVNGETTPTDLDHFAFDGRAGQRVRLELAAERLESRLDATLRLLDPAGREIAESRDVLGVDPLLDLVLPADGRYVVKVHDVVYGGSPDHSYRLSLGDGPRLDAIVPVAARPGVESTFTLIGRNLGGTPAPDLLIDGRPLERRTVRFTPPPSGDLDSQFPSSGYLASQAAPRRGFEYALRLPSGTSNPVFLAEAADPVVVEREPNDDEAHAQDVPVPCDLSGTFGAPNDRDVFRFAAHKGEVWWIEAAAERLGSSADPTFVIQKVPATGAPQDLATGEDTPDQGGGVRFGTGSVDALLRWQAPEDGTYQVVVNDLYASQRGDARLFYRLNIRPERPDFRLFVVPTHAKQVDSVTLGAGGRASAYVLAWRIDGFAGPIRVEARDLPPGVRCDPVTIAAGQVLAPIVFEASEGARPGVGLARLVGRSRFGDRKDELRYVSGATRLGPDLAREALAGGLVWPPGNALAPTIAPARVTRGFVVAVRETAPLSLSASPATVAVAQGHQLKLDVTVTRRDAFTEAVAVTAADLPPNFTNATTTVAKTETRGVLSLFVAKNAAPGEYTFLLQGTGPYPFSKDPKAKTKPNINLSEPSNTLTVTVRPAPVSLALNAKGGALKPGGTLEIDVALTRAAGFAGEAALGLLAPAALKLSAEPATIAAGQTSARLVVRAAADSPAGAAAGVAVRALTTVRGEPIDVDEPLPLTIKK